VVQRSEQRLDIAVVADVVSEIRHRRGIDRRYPDRIDAEPREVVEAFAYSLQIADAVAIRILKGAGIDLIDDPVFPPDKIGHASVLESVDRTVSGSTSSHVLQFSDS